MQSASRTCGVELCKRQGMQPVVMISTLERIPSLPIVIQAGGTRYQKPASRLVRVVETFDQVSPSLVFVNFIENQQVLPTRQSTL
jgi:hypothetical protein